MSTESISNEQPVNEVTQSPSAEPVNSNEKLSASESVNDVTQSPSAEPVNSNDKLSASESANDVTQSPSAEPVNSNEKLSASESANDATQLPSAGSISDKPKQLGVNLYRNGMLELIKELEEKHGGFINRALSRVLYIHEIAVIRSLKKMLPDYTDGGLSAAAEQQKLNTFVDKHIITSPHKKMNEIFTKYKELYQVTTEKTSEENIDLDDTNTPSKKTLRL